MGFWFCLLFLRFEYLVFVMFVLCWIVWCFVLFACFWDVCCLLVFAVFA